MKLIFSIAFLLTHYFAVAQFMQDVSGKPYLQNSVEEHDGSPLLFQAWVKANVVTAEGKEYKDMLVNLDINQDLPVFLSDGKILTFSESIDGFSIGDSVTGKMNFKRGSSINPTLPNVLMEVISESPLLLKKQEKKLVETTSYGSTSKAYRYAESKSYYIAIESSYKKVVLTKESAEKVFIKFWKQIEQYAKANNINFKSEEGWRQISNFYQSILK